MHVTSDPDSPIQPERSLSPVATLTLDISGMKCAGCVRAVETQLNQQPGVVSSTVNLVTEVALVDYQPQVVDAQRLAKTLTDAGFPSTVRWTSNEEDATPSIHTIDPAEKQRLETQRQFRQVVIASLLLLCSLVGHLKHFGWAIPLLSNIEVHAAIATLALIGPGRPIFVDGWNGLKRRAPNMNTLVGLGTLAAYLTSVIALAVPQLGWECFFDEPVMLVGFILLGRALEQRAKGQAAAAFQALLSLQPNRARWIQLSNLRSREQLDLTTLLQAPVIELPAEHIKVGEYLKVLPGDQIPVDGEVVIGQTTVNESMLTGESAPVIKQVGDGVSAGSINQSGAIALRATRTGRDTTLSQMIALVEAAQTRKAPIQTLADLVAGYFTYGVLTLATLTFVFWYGIGTRLWPDLVLQSGHWMIHATPTLDMTGMVHHAMTLTPSPLLLSLKLAIAVLVIACPCALGLATPTAILVGSSLGAERGILIRGGDVLEQVHHLTTVVFDKTGTLTTGHPTVTDCLSLHAAYSSERVLHLAAAVEQGSPHPVAEAIRTEAEQRQLPPLAASDFYTEAGLGVSARIEQQLVLLGRADWLQQQSVDLDSATPEIEALAAQGKTVVYLAVDGVLAGAIAVQDTLRPDAQTTIEQLRQMNLQILMLTGDHPAAAHAVARSLGLSESQVMANMLPHEKVNAIAQLQQQGNCVAMVGDGINDSPALVQADISIALHSGTQAAIEAAEIVLMRDRLTDVVQSIRLSQATFNKIRQNLFWAFAYNVMGIPAAAGFLLPAFGVALSPATAGALMAFSSLSVVSNSLLLRRTAPFHQP